MNVDDPSTEKKTEMNLAYPKREETKQSHKIYPK